MRITTLVILLVVVVVGCVGFCSDDKLKNEVLFERTSSSSSSESLLSSMSSRQRKHVRKELMHVLGLSHIPRPSGPGRHSRAGARGDEDDGAQMAAPKYMLSLYRSLQGYLDGGEEGDRSLRSRDSPYYGQRLSSKVIEQQLRTADTVTSFINQANGSSGSDSLMIRCRFELSEISASDVLTGAVLRIYKHPKQTIRRPTEKITIDIQRSIDNGSVDDGDRRRLHQRLMILSSRSGWIDIDVTPLVSRWTKNKTNRPTDNTHGLQISVFNYRGELVDPGSVGIAGENSSPDKQVFLVAFFKNNPDAAALTKQQVATGNARHKRSTADDNRRNARKSRQQEANVMSDDHQAYRSYNNNKHALKCQLRTLKVSFKDLKWQDWIIAPEGYGANYCDGDCVSSLHAHNATNHAIVQKMAHLIKPTTVPKPCCAPTKLAGLSVLYFDDNSNVILKKYRNMVVKSCGCH